MFRSDRPALIPRIRFPTEPWITIMKPVCFTSLLCFFCLAQTASADSWPQYRGHSGDGKSTETMPSTVKTKILWKVPAPLGFSSFTVADDRAFTLVGKEDHEVCVALNADTGATIWEVTLGSSDYGHGGGDAGAPGNKGGDGPRATPVTDGKNVYVYDAQLVLRCLDAATGNEVWKHDIMAEFAGRNIKWFNATSPVMDGDRIYVGGGGAGQSFLAFDKNDGALQWSTGDDTITHATPQIAEIEGKKQIIFFTQSGLTSLDTQDGQLIWKTDFPFSVSTAASPVVSDDLVYCSAGYGVGAGLFRVNGKQEPDEVWFKSNELMNHWSTPLARDGHLYGIFEFKKYGRAPLQCVDLATGEIKWSERGFGPGNCILVDDRLVVLSDAGEVVIVEANPNGYREISRQDVLEGKCWSTPAYSDGRIYVRSTQEAACLQLIP